jgi:hypothetical protein
VIGIDNRSGFPAELLSIPDIDGQEIPLLIVSSTWLHSDRGGWEAGPEPLPICFADEYFGEPSAYSSVRNEAQVACEKRFVDVLVNGTAYAPRGVPTRAVTVELYLGGIAKQVRVVGDRYRTSLGASLPAEFVTMPVTYERAYGGADTRDPDPRKHTAWKQNPAGVGFRGVGSQSKEVATEYPNLEPMTGSLEGPPAGFGIISRGWSPRLEFAGTFDQSWLDSQWPLMPRDLDVRHNQAAPPDQQLASLQSGDIVRLVNFTPDGVWQFAAPSTTLPVWLMGDGGKRELSLRMDTLLIEPDHRRVTLTFRLNLESVRGTDRIREIIVGSVTPGYLRAKETRKPYVDRRNPRESVGDLPL